MPLAAYPTVVPTVTADPPDGVTLHFGPNTVRIARADIRDIVHNSYMCSAVQALVALAAAGVDPMTATFGQVQSVLQGTAFYGVG